MKLAAARIFVDDLGIATRFYRGDLGLPVRATSAAAGYLVLDAGGCDLVVEQVPPDADPDDRALVGRFTGLSLTVTDVTRTHRELSGRGVRFDGEPELQAWGGVLVTLRDPAGNQLQLVQYPAAP